MLNVKNQWLRQYTAEAIQYFLVPVKVFDELWHYETENELTSAMLIDLKSRLLGPIRQISLSKIDQGNENLLEALIEAKEPNYEEKLQVLSGVGKWKKCAMEVFPTTDNLVDEVNMYHIWELQESAFPFDISPISQLPDSLEEVSEDIHVQYAMRTANTKYGRVAYLYLKPHAEELRWKEKQKIKNEIIGEDLTAVEIISDKAKNLGYSCLVCLPWGYEFDFGLHKDPKK